MSNNTFKPGWTETDDGSDGEALTVTRAAVTNKAHFITAFSVVITSGNTSQGITIELRDGSTKVYKDAIKSGASIGDKAGIVFPDPIRISQGAAANLVISDPGTGGVITGNIVGFTE